MRSIGHVLLIFLGLFCVVGAGARAQTTQFAAVETSTIEARLREVPSKNPEREATLKKMFEESGCKGPDLTEQPVKHQRLPNIICTLSGNGSRNGNSVIIIGAHFDHVPAGIGVIDNWSGASLLPSLFESLRHHPRKHSFVFVGFTAEEDGMVGSSFYAKQMTPAQVGGTRVMVNLDSLALGPTKVWLTHSDPHFAGALEAVARSMGLPLQAVNGDQVGEDDSGPFIRRKIPTLMVHSVTQATWPILHTSRDNWAAVKLSDYNDTYRLLAAYLAFIDTIAD